MPKISVIIPVYNVKDYIETCLFSVFNQNIKDIEIICVNDGSTDGTDEILNSLRRNNNFTIASTENRGPASARNLGLSIASGDYILFLDSDDQLSSDAFKVTLSIMEQENADVVVFGGTIIGNIEGRGKTISTQLNTSDKIYCGKDILEKALFDEPSCDLFVWNKLFRRSLFKNGVRFDEKIRIGEDRALLFDIFPTVKKLVFTSAKLYQYRVKSENSITSTYATEHYKKAISHIHVAEHIMAAWKNNKHISSTALNRMLLWIYDYAFATRIQNLTSEEAKNIAIYLKNLYFKYFNWFIDNPQMTELTKYLL